MTITATSPSIESTEREIITRPDTSRAWWFLGTLAVFRNPPGSPRTPAVIELTVPPGGSPPRHVHDVLDDAFLVLDGEVVVGCGDQLVLAPPGAYVVVPSGVEHTFRVTSPTPARLLLVHNDDSFLRLIEAIGAPTTEHRLPPPGGFDVDFDTLVRVNAENDSRIVGPSLEDEQARAIAPSDPAPFALGSIHHLSIAVTDLLQSERWYSDAFGCVRVDGEVAPDGTGHLILLNPLGGWLLTLSTATSAGVEHVAVACSDRQMLVDWQAVLTERRVTPGSITDAPYGSGFVVRDPDGVEIELFAPTPA